MPGDRTPAIERALDAAAAWAGKLNRPLGPATLLLGLLDEEEGHVAALLVRAGLAPDAVRSRLAVLSADIDAGSVEALLGEAGHLARSLGGERTPRSAHVLLAILRLAPAVSAELQQLGLDPAKVETAIGSVDAGLLGADSDLQLGHAPEALDAARILDASANRAREALRVIEDYCRFALNDAFLSRAAKEIRHDLAAALDLAGPLPLLQARDTPGDVGTVLSTPAEWRRESPLDVAQTNLKRLQEALRSLEEFGKLADARFGPAVEQLRYRTYTLERALVLGHGARERLASARLYLIVTGAACATTLEFVINEAVAGGVDMVQLREKNLGDRDLLERARRVRRWTSAAGALFIVNDRPDIARLVEADGVQLGQDDMSVREARRLMGPDALIGVSTHSLEQLRQAIRDGAAYLGVGPVYASTTKQFQELAGLEYVRQAAAETSLPAFALGGITAGNLDAVLAAGARRVAVSSAICSADEPRTAAQLLRSQLDAASGRSA